MLHTYGLQRPIHRYVIKFPKTEIFGEPRSLRDVTTTMPLSIMLNGLGAMLQALVQFVVQETVFSLPTQLWTFRRGNSRFFFNTPTT